LSAAAPSFLHGLQRVTRQIEWLERTGLPEDLHNALSRNDDPGPIRVTVLAQSGAIAVGDVGGWPIVR
tara:strand:- start:130 stop:333 length:204 start_codon:yes stop_codon:yes gene_type:complete